MTEKTNNQESTQKSEGENQLLNREVVDKVLTILKNKKQSYEQIDYKAGVAEVDDLIKAIDEFVETYNPDEDNLDGFISHVRETSKEITDDGAKFIKIKEEFDREKDALNNASEKGGLRKKLMREHPELGDDITKKEALAIYDKLMTLRKEDLEKIKKGELDDFTDFDFQLALDEAREKPSTPKTETEKKEKTVKKEGEAVVEDQVEVEESKEEVERPDLSFVPEGEAPNQYTVALNRAEGIEKNIIETGIYSEAKTTDELIAALLKEHGDAMLDNFNREIKTADVVEAIKNTKNQPELLDTIPTRDGLRGNLKRLLVRERLLETMQESGNRKEKESGDGEENIKNKGTNKKYKDTDPIPTAKKSKEEKDAEKINYLVDQKVELTIGDKKIKVKIIDADNDNNLYDVRPTGLLGVMGLGKKRVSGEQLNKVADGEKKGGFWSNVWKIVSGANEKGEVKKKENRKEQLKNFVKEPFNPEKDLSENLVYENSVLEQFENVLPKKLKVGDTVRFVNSMGKEVTGDIKSLPTGKDHPWYGIAYKTLYGGVRRDLVQPEKIIKNKK